MEKENNTSEGRGGMSEVNTIPDLSQILSSEPHWTNTKYSKNMLMDALGPIRKVVTYCNFHNMQYAKPERIL